jgi:general secretion pathway protein A
VQQFSPEQRIGKVYVSFFNLREQPFNLTPDPRFLFLSSQHEEALSHLLYGIYERKGFIEITGEVGTGKTLLCRALLERLDESVSTALIFNSYLTDLELLEAILNDFGLTSPDSTRKAYLDTLNQYLLDEFAAGRNAVVIIDESQNMALSVLEQLRMLSNLETDDGKLLQVVLIGQPELRDKLSLHGMRQLDQRIAVRYHLHALTLEDTKQYILHRLSVAGGANAVTFHRRAWSLIHRDCGGLPRRINMLCDRMLMTAYVQGSKAITPSIVRQSIRDLGGTQQVSRRSHVAGVHSWGRRLAYGSLVAALVLGLAGTVFFSTPIQRYIERLKPMRLFALARLPSQPTSQSPETLSPEALDLDPSMATSPAIKPQPPRDMQLLQTLWRVKVRAEGGPDRSRSSRQVLQVEQAAQEMGLAIARFDTGMQQLQQLSRPCLIAMTLDPSQPQTTLRVFVQAQDDAVHIYREPDGVQRIPRHLFEQQWYGIMYLTLEADRYRDIMLVHGMQGDSVEKLQNILHALGYFQGPVSGYFESQTLNAVKAFQRDHRLHIDGQVGPRTLMLLQHIGGLF